MTDKRRRKESVDAKLLALVPHNMQVGAKSIGARVAPLCPASAA